MNNRDLVALDLDVLWHPCTQMKDHEFLPLIPIKKAHGVYLEDFEENRYIDAIGSWWVNIFGHTNGYINSKIKEQLEQLEHVILAGFTHEGIIKLSKRLTKLTSLDKCFYADNGSSGIEVALKMSFHAHKNSNKNKNLFVSLENSYHGETLGALSVGDVRLYKNTYEPLLIKTIQTSVPKDQSIQEALRAAKEFEKLCQKHKDEISSIIFEPLIQGAGGMHMYNERFLQEIASIAKRYDIFTIADEVMSGFGRTGEMFGCQKANITPDFLVLSKALTGGYLPLSVVLTNNEIYSKFYCDYSENRAFLHSHSYTGNALACAAANATLDIFENENIIEKNRTLAKLMSQNLKKFHNLKNVANIRQTGVVCAFDIVGYDAKDRIGLKIYEYALKNGVLLRPLGATIYFMPPYIITQEECEKMFDVAYKALKTI